MVRVLTEKEFRDHYGHGDPDRRHVRRHTVAGRPTPHVELTSYLVALAAQHGYAVDAEVLDQTVGLHPQEVILRAAPGPATPPPATCNTCWPPQSASSPTRTPTVGAADRLRDHDTHLAQVRAAAARRYAACCHTLLPTGLIWPAQPAGDTTVPAHPGNPPEEATKPATR